MPTRIDGSERSPTERPVTGAPVTEEDLARIAREVAVRLQAFTARLDAADPRVRSDALLHHVSAGPG
ncbi:MAG: hypothetical protein U9N79_11135 [Actinomycetota bacterium]|nr:hypothetical protein [Actinomycetota bacterium]MEA2024823.1 hypothetical protein [Actinomycetota bacterium]